MSYCGCTFDNFNSIFFCWNVNNRSQCVLKHVPAQHRKEPSFLPLRLPYTHLRSSRYPPHHRSAAGAMFALYNHKLWIRYLPVFLDRFYTVVGEKHIGLNMPAFITKIVSHANLWILFLFCNSWSTISMLFAEIWKIFILIMFHNFALKFGSDCVIFEKYIRRSVVLCPLNGNLGNFFIVNEGTTLVVPAFVAWDCCLFR